MEEHFREAQAGVSIPRLFDFVTFRLASSPDTFSGGSIRVEWAHHEGPDARARDHRCPVCLFFGSLCDGATCRPSRIDENHPTQPGSGVRPFPWRQCANDNDPGTNQIVVFREPRPMRYVLLDPRGTNTSAGGSQPWTRARLESGPTNTVEFGNRVVLQLAPGTDLNSLLTNRGLTLSRTVRSNLVILQAPDSQTAINAAEALAGQAGVQASYPIMRR